MKAKLLWPHFNNRDADPEIERETCGLCGGSGKYLIYDYDEYTWYFGEDNLTFEEFEKVKPVEIICPNCDGWGYVEYWY